MPIISECCEPGCVTLTIGEYCIEHERTATAHAPLLRDVVDVPLKHDATGADERAAALHGPAAARFELGTISGKGIPIGERVNGP